MSTTSPLTLPLDSCDDEPHALHKKAAHRRRRRFNKQKKWRRYDVEQWDL